MIIEKNKNREEREQKRKDIACMFLCMYKEGHREAYVLLIVIIIFLYSYTSTRPHLPSFLNG